MKISLLFIVPLLAVAGWLALRMMDRSEQAEEELAPVSWQGSPPTQILSDANEIFKKAFWRRPSAEDEIVHAERHEWRDVENLERWQWFIEVRASAGLVKYLRDDNAFGLVPASTLPEIDEAPSWFRFDPADFVLYTAPHGGMRLMFSKEGNTLYAMDSGRGFTKGLPEPPPAAQEAPVPGRLPTTLPPIPNSP